jgi:hypothetical protein
VTYPEVTGRSGPWAIVARAIGFSDGPSGRVAGENRLIGRPQTSNPRKACVLLPWSKDYTGVPEIDGPAFGKSYSTRIGGLSLLVAPRKLEFVKTGDR